MRPILPLAVLSLLAACAGDPFKDQTILNSDLGAGGEIGTAPAPHMIVGYVQTDIFKVPTVNPKSGDVFRVSTHCGQTSTIPTYGILNGNASANAHPTNGAATALAVNRGGMTGEAAVAEAMGDVASRVGGGYDVWRAYDDCSKIQTPSQAAVDASVEKASLPPASPPAP